MKYKTIKDKSKDDDFYKALDEFFGVDSHNDYEEFKEVKENIEFEDYEDDLEILRNTQSFICLSERL